MPDEIHLHAKALPCRFDNCGLRRIQEVEDADDEEQRCILEQRDERVDQRWNEFIARSATYDSFLLVTESFLGPRAT